MDPTSGKPYGQKSSDTFPLSIFKKVGTGSKTGSNKKKLWIKIRQKNLDPTESR
jgi:hypothetical protein